MKPLLDGSADRKGQPPALQHFTMVTKELAARNVQNHRLKVMFFFQPEEQEIGWAAELWLKASN